MQIWRNVFTDTIQYSVKGLKDTPQAVSLPALECLT